MTRPIEIRMVEGKCNPCPSGFFPTRSREFTRVVVEKMFANGNRDCWNCAEGVLMEIRRREKELGIGVSPKREARIKGREKARGARNFARRRGL